MRRAQLHYDFQNAHHPYIIHRYKSIVGVYTYSNIDRFSNQISQNLSDRNPPVPRSYVEDFLRIHEADRPPYVENDVYANYELNGMTRAEHYLEYHLDQFYQILLCFQKLQKDGIRTKEDDIWRKEIPYRLLPKNYQEMLYNRNVYREVLFEVRRSQGYNSNGSQTDLPTSSRTCRENIDIDVDRHSTRNSALMIPQFLKTNECVKGNVSDYDDSINCSNEYCDSDDVDHVSSHDQTIAVPVPSFSDEPFYVGAVLDYALVEWSSSVCNMIRTRDGRRLLRKYVENALIVLKCALNVFNNHDHFRYLLRVLWNRRAQYYFDGNDDNVPYIRHLFTMNHMFPHTYDNHTIFFRRNAQHFVERNPRVPERYVNYFLNMHSPNEPSHGEYDVLSAYEYSGMGFAELYLEIHLDQFYQVLFFFLELQANGITSDEEDIDDGPISYDLIPEDIQGFVSDGCIYRDYLLQKRKQLIEIADRSKIEIGQSSRVREEDLISLSDLLWVIPNTVSTTTLSTTTTTTGTTSTTTRYAQQSKRKGSVYVNENGKHFFKKPKTTFLESCCKIIRNPIQNIPIRIEQIAFRDVTITPLQVQKTSFLFFVL